MQSLKSKLILGMVRNRHLFKFKLKPEVIDEHFDVEKFRKEVDDASRKTEKIPEAIKVQPTRIPESFTESGLSNSKEYSRNFASPNPAMYAECLNHKDAPKEKVILYIHGGGFMSGS